jgi:hypothetical protein
MLPRICAARCWASSPSASPTTSFIARRSAIPSCAAQRKNSKLHSRTPRRPARWSSKLFQDLDGFSPDDYNPFANVKPGLDRVLAFLRASLTADGRRIEAQNDGTYIVKGAEQKVIRRFTLDRDAARARSDLELLGLDHPLVEEAIKRWQALSPETIGVAVSGSEGPGVITWWLVETRAPSGEYRATVLPLGVSDEGKRNAPLERLGAGVFERTGRLNGTTVEARKALLNEQVEPMLERELRYREIVPEGGSYAAKLIGWVEVSGAKA